VGYVAGSILRLGMGATPGMSKIESSGQILNTETVVSIIDATMNARIRRVEQERVTLANIAKIEMLRAIRRELIDAMRQQASEPVSW
jgi:hypothetical protein